MKPRWKVACINWGGGEFVPHAVAYIDVDGDAECERYFASWEQAVRWLYQRRDLLDDMAEAVQANKRLVRGRA